MFVYDVTQYPLNQNEWSFPMCECFHILGFAVAIGSVVMVDLRMMGLGLMHVTTSQLWKDTKMWTMWALTLVLISGPLIFFSDPFMYLHNKSFVFKMTMLGLAIIYNYTIHRKFAMDDAKGGAAKVVGALSVALWLSVVVGGIFIAFV